MYNIFRIWPYKHYFRDDNNALVAAEDELKAQTLLRDTISFIEEEMGITDNYALRGRIDEIGAETPERGVLYMSFPDERASSGIAAVFFREQKFHEAYLGFRETKKTGTGTGTGGSFPIGI